jgi:hypothetical protein
MEQVEQVLIPRGAAVLRASFTMALLHSGGELGGFPAWAQVMFFSASVVVAFHQRGGSGHSWSREAAEDGDSITPGSVLESDAGVESGSNTFLIEYMKVFSGYA